MKFTLSLTAPTERNSKVRVIDVVCQEINSGNAVKWPRSIADNVMGAALKLVL